MKKTHRVAPHALSERLFNVFMAFMLVATMMPVSVAAYASSSDEGDPCGAPAAQPTCAPSPEEDSNALPTYSQDGEGGKASGAQGLGSGLQGEVDAQLPVERLDVAGSPSASADGEGGEGERAPRDWSGVVDALSFDGSLEISPECPTALQGAAAAQEAASPADGSKAAISASGEAAAPGQSVALPEAIPADLEVSFDFGPIPEGQGVQAGDYFQVMLPEGVSAAGAEGSFEVCEASTGVQVAHAEIVAGGGASDSL